MLVSSFMFIYQLKATSLIESWELKEFKGIAAEEVIKSVFPNRNIINMDEEDRSKIINKNIYELTPKEFIDKIKGVYVHNIIADIGTGIKEYEYNCILTKYKKEKKMYTTRH